MSRKILSITAILGKLDGTRRNGTGWIARCPAHDDKRPSLSVGEGDDGRVLFKCFAGCTTDAVCSALGISTSDLFPKNNGSSRPTRHPTKPKPKPMATFPTAEAAVAWLEANHGAPSATWTYHNADGERVGLVVRWDKPNGTKDILPVSKHGAGWQIVGMTTPRPLYRRPELADATVVYVVEGEKTTDALAGLGLIVTTSAHGSKDAKGTDWSPLAGKLCIILPDNDLSGRSYADDVVEIRSKLSSAPTTKIVALPGLPERGDAVEFIAARRNAGLTDDAIRGEIEALADATEAVEPTAKPTNTIPQWRPFPTASLPKNLRGFVASVAVAVGCDESFVALSALTMLASCIGNTRRIRIKIGWTEPSLIFAAGIAESGDKKTPAFRAVLRPLREIQQQLYDEQAGKLEEYEKDMLEWKARKNDPYPPEKPKPPAVGRVIISDATFEALAPILLENPRGALLHRDELSAWFGSFDRYSSARGSDCGNWLSIYDCEPITIDRKTGIPRTIYVPSPCVSIMGTIQPGTLARVLTSENLENGLAPRFVFARPPRKVQKWTDAIVPEPIRSAFSNLVHRLRELQPAKDRADRPYALAIPLSPEALALFVKFHDAMAEERRDLTGVLAACWSKLVGSAARLALIIHYARWAAEDATLEDPEVIDAESIEAGIKLVGFFKNEATRVYAAFSESAEEVESRELVDWIRGKGGSISVRHLVRGPRRFRGKTAEAQAALDELVEAGFGTWTEGKIGKSGGPPSRQFHLGDSGDGDTTPTLDSAAGGYVASRHVATPENTPDNGRERFTA